MLPLKVYGNIFVNIVIIFIYPLILEGLYCEILKKDGCNP